MKIKNSCFKIISFLFCHSMLVVGEANGLGFIGNSFSCSRQSLFYSVDLGIESNTIKRASTMTRSGLVSKLFRKFVTVVKIT